MKSLKLISLIVLLYSCTPNVNNTIPTTNQSIKPSSSITSSPTVKSSPSPTSIPSITPSITISSPSSDYTFIPTPNPINIKEIEKFDRIKIYKDNTLMAEGYTTDLQQHFNLDYKSYNSSINEKNTFKAEIMYKDKTVSSENIVWSVSENNSFAEVNQEGLLTNGSTEAKIRLRASYKYDLTKYTEFEVKILKTLEYKILESKCDTVFATRYIERFEDGSRAIKPSGTAGSPGCCWPIPTKIMGKVLDNKGNPVDGATVTAKSLGYVREYNINETVKTEKDGIFRFYSAEVGSTVLITASKDGLATRTKTELIKYPNEECIYYDFQGITSLQDEPEIASLKINGKQVNGSSNGDVFTTTANAPKNSKPTPTNMDNREQITDIGNVPSLIGVNSDKLEVEMTFSEPINVDDVKSNFRITSQSGFDNKITSFIINANTPNSQFDISADQKVITFKTNKAILANKGGDEARYLIDFSQPFRDKTNKPAIDRRYFRFSNSQINDFATFSVKNDETAPKLLGIIAKDGINGENDTIELKYSEPMELINQSSYAAGLSDPLAPSNLSRQLWYRDANSTISNTPSVTNSTTDNNATLIGFLNGSDTDINQFRASYMIGRVLASEISNANGTSVKTSILGNISRTPNTTPVKGNTSINALIRSSKINDSNILLEFSPDAFDKDDRVIVSVANRITGSFVDRNRVPSVNDDLSVSIVGAVFEYASIYDPAGRLVDSGDSTTSANIDVNNSQRVATAN